jgi:hypothetical protein
MTFAIETLYMYGKFNIAYAICCKVPVADFLTNLALVP